MTAVKSGQGGVAPSLELADYLDIEHLNSENLDSTPESLGYIQVHMSFQQFQGWGSKTVEM